MKAEITRDVIQDLLPLYLAGEASEDTAALVLEYLKIDPELEEIAMVAKKNDLLGEVPVPLTKEDAMEAYEDAKKWMVVRTLGLAVIITGVVMCLVTFIPVAYMFLIAR
ncbi:MAG: hypothetical protein JXB30_09945 [Anaerolineae bacterium]|nr:hypothetical protein [Anaerolineae bacterium]